MSDFIIQLDTNIFLWLNSFHHIFWDIFMKMATGKLIWIGMYAAILFAIWRAYGWRTLVIMAVASALTVTLADQLTASLLRPMFERLRPANLDNPISAMVHVVDGYRGGRYGFPSCHAANTFAITTLLSLLVSRWRFTIFMVLWAMLNCYSRIYLGVHYPGDLLAGLVVGCSCGAFIYLISRIAIRHWKGAEGPGKTDTMRMADINGWRFHYRPVDVPISVGILTVVYIFICAASIFI